MRHFGGPFAENKSKGRGPDLLRHAKFDFPLIPLLV